MEPVPPSPEPRARPRVPPAALALRTASLALLLGAFGWLVAGLGSAGTPGADEALNGFTALRLATAVQAWDWGGFWGEFHRPDFYTPLGRLGMSLGFLLFGDGFDAPRIATALVWFLTIGLAGLLARRVAGPDAADAATFWTVLGGVTCSLGIDYARGAFSEPWSALSNLVSVFLYLRARDTGGKRWALACGLSLGAALVIKYTYALYVIGAVGLSGLWDLWRRPAGVRAGRLAAWCAVGLVAVLLWWFVLPLPAGPTIGRLHREAFVRYLEKAAILSTMGPLAILIYWPFKGCLSLVVFALQLAGIAWGVARWRDPAARLCAILAVVGPVGYMAYPFRIDRFLMPTFFGAWVLAAALVARAQVRLAPRRRPLAGAALVLVAWLTVGVGARAVFALAPMSEERDPARRAEVPAWHRPYVVVPDPDAAAATIREWRHPYRPRLVPAGGPPGVERVLEVAAEHLQPLQRFLWIGGTGTEIPLCVVDWSLYRRYGERGTLHFARPESDWLWADPGFDEPAFRAWAAGFAQVGVLEPPDPKLRPRPFEVQFAQWMRAHPGFEEVARESVEIESRPGEVNAFEVTIYRRRSGG